MTHDKRDIIKGCLLRLIGLKYTGTPAELAGRFGISERSIKRMISELRREGYNIVFWHGGNTYIFDEGYKQNVRVADYCTEDSG